jgi:peptide/nickel transport system ATP-binding protein
MNTNIQEIKDLSIGFKSQKGEQISILRNITTNIRKGETVGIVGESGSGKSTLALAMMGYIKHGLFTTGGECLFKSQDLLKLNNKELEILEVEKLQ